MDAPFNQPNPTSSGFSFPVTVPVAEPVAPVVQPTISTTETFTTVVGASPAIPQPPVSQPPSEPFRPVEMKITEQQKPKSKTKDVVLVGLLLILLAGAVFGFTKVRSLLSSAAEDGCVPIDIVEQDLTSNSIVVSYTTSEACKMQVAYGVDEVLGLQLSEQTAATSHRIKLTPLMPSTPYRYQIRNDQKKYEPTRGFLTLPVTAAQTPTVVVPTRSLTPVVTVIPTQTAGRPTGAVTVTPIVTQTAGTVTPAVKYTITDFQLHFGSVDPRFDTDKNGIVNTRDWQLYSK